MTRVFIGLLVCCGAFLTMTPANEKPKPFQSTKDEIKIAELTNLERKKDDKRSLVLSAALSKVARAHSENMARQEKMEHKLDMKDVFNRIEDAKLDYEVAGENIACYNQGVAMTTIMKGWMDSELHRKNILYMDFTEIGVGIARAKNGDLYLTQVFSKPPK